MRNLSIVIPSHNESESLEELFSRLDIISKINFLNIQIILVDDGSTDNTQEIVSSFLFENIKEISYIKFRRNFGKSEALSEGVRKSKYDLILTMDADLQDQPEEIINLINKMDEGYDLVSGWKRNRLDSVLLKNIPSKIFNFLISKSLGFKFKDINSGFKLYRKEIWNEIDIYGDFHRFIPILAFSKGFKVVEVEVNHDKRKYGKSKYGLDRFLKGIFDLCSVYFLVCYESRPFHFFGKISLCLIFLGFAGLIYLSFLWFNGISIGTRPLLLVSIFNLIIGLQILLFGFTAQQQIQLLRDTKKNSYSSIKLIKNFNFNKKTNG